MFHPRRVHHQHDHVRLRSSDLKSVTASLHSNGRRSAPTDSVCFPANNEPASVFSSDSKCYFLDARHDHHAIGIVKETFGNTLVRRVHNLLQHIRRRSETFCRSVCVALIGINLKLMSWPPPSGWSISLEDTLRK